MKKFALLFMNALFVLSLIACGASVNDNTDTPSTNEKPTTKFESGKTLIVYYSASGNTQAAAKYIADATEGELFELVPVEAYNDEDLNWRNENSRVVYEYEHPNARKVKLVENTVSDWESYDTVFIGYPIWWGIAAWPVNDFIEANDFSGKSVIPFCTSSSSDLGESAHLLEEASGSGNWREGVRFSSRPSEEMVRDWLESLSQE